MSEFFELQKFKKFLTVTGTKSEYKTATILPTTPKPFIDTSKKTLWKNMTKKFFLTVILQKKSVVLEKEIFDVSLNLRNYLGLLSEYLADLSVIYCCTFGGGDIVSITFFSVLTFQ